jgi:invasion protein IalB
LNFNVFYKKNPEAYKPVLRLASLAAVILLILGLPQAATTPAFAQQGAVKATHGAWQLNCGKPPGKKEEKCALVQSVTAEDRPNVGLTVMFLKTVNGDKQLLRIVAPLGVLLPAGLGLKIDGKDIGQAPFIKCGKIGCISEVVVKDDLMSKMIAGKTAIFIIFQTPEAGIGIPISLTGFKAGLASVK